VEHAEQVDVELRTNIIHRHLFEESEMAVTGVVHEHVDAAEAGGCRLHRGFRLRRIGDIQLDGQEAAAVGSQAPRDRRTVARRRDDIVACLDCSLGDPQAEAPAGAGNEPRFST